MLLHGFTGSPAELRYLGERLWQEGFSVEAPCLPGHGSSSGERSGVEPWLGTARAALESASAGGPVRLVGLSMGALLATVLAAERPERIAALALLAPAAGLTQPGATVAWLAERVPALTRAIPWLPKIGGSDLGDAAARRWNPTGERVPTHGLAELVRLQRRAWEAAPGVRAPAALLLAGLDRTVDSRAARALAGRLSGPTEIVEFSRSGHLMALDFERGEVARRIVELFRRS